MKRHFVLSECHAGTLALSELLEDRVITRPHAPSN
jgi:hypothetical protein